MTLICDPLDCGLRASEEDWNHAPTVVRQIPRVSREREEELRLRFGDLVPCHPGEWIVVDWETDARKDSRS